MGLGELSTGLASQYRVTQPYAGDAESVQAFMQ